MTELSIAFGSLLIGIGCLWYDKTYWKRHGVPGPDSNIFVGSTMRFLKNGHLYDVENMKRFDRTYGDFLFGKKTIVSMDLDLIRSVLVKEFPHFENRFGTKEPNPTLDKNNLVMRNVLAMKKGEDWKRIRNVITPAFTTGKMRKLVPLLVQSASELRSVIERFIDEGKDIPLKE